MKGNSSDRNTGLEGARKAALAVDGKIALPPQPQTDWNDQHAALGKEKAEQLYEQAIRSPIDDLVAAVQKGDFAALASFTSVEYDGLREQVAKQANVRVSTLDKEVEKIRSAQEVVSQGCEVLFPPPNPWPRYVRFARLLDAMFELIARYIIVGEAERVALVLWAAHTHVFDHFRHSPILALIGEMGSGKTTVHEFLTGLTMRSLAASNITSAALFRTIDRYQPTLFIDEYDSFGKHDEAMRGVLNSGHTKRSAFVIRLVGDSHEPRLFSTWCPKAIGCIGRLPSTIADRSIQIRITRKLPTDRIERLRERAEGDAFDLIRRKLERFATDSENSLRETRVPRLRGLRDRANDCWLPLRTIAALAGDDWLQRADDAAYALSADSSRSDTIRTLLLRHLAPLVLNDDSEYLRTADMLQHLNSLEEAPWSEFKSGGGSSS